MEEGVLREDVEFEDVASYIRHLEANRTLCPRDRHEALAGLSIKNDQTIPIESVMSLDTLISLVTNHFGKDD